MGYVDHICRLSSPKFTQVYGFQRDSRNSGYKVAMLNRESPLKGEERT